MLHKNFYFIILFWPFWGVCSSCNTPAMSQSGAVKWTLFVHKKMNLCSMACPSKNVYVRLLITLCQISENVKNGSCSGSSWACQDGFEKSDMIYNMKPFDVSSMLKTKKIQKCKNLILPIIYFDKRIPKRL